MTDFSNKTSRNKFVVTVALPGGFISLKGYLENPSDTNECHPPLQEVSEISSNSEQSPEINKVKLGYIPFLKQLP